jgi:hypothetical protein
LVQRLALAAPITAPGPLAEPEPRRSWLRWCYGARTFRTRNYGRV